MIYGEIESSQITITLSFTTSTYDRRQDFRHS